MTHSYITRMAQQIQVLHTEGMLEFFQGLEFEFGLYAGKRPALLLGVSKAGLIYQQRPHCVTVSNSGMTELNCMHVSDPTYAAAMCLITCFTHNLSLCEAPLTE